MDADCNPLLIVFRDSFIRVYPWLSFVRVRPWLVFARVRLWRDYDLT